MQTPCTSSRGVILLDHTDLRKMEQFKQRAANTGASGKVVVKVGVPEMCFCNYIELLFYLFRLLFHSIRTAFMDL